MRIGLNGGASTVAEAIAFAKAAKDDGFTSLSFANIFGLDAIATCAVVGSHVDGVELTTAVVPTYPRHPHAMAQAAMTAADACGGRFTLGIGLSHQIVIETMFGMSYDKPARHMREYLAVLLPLLREGKVSYDGDQYHVHAPLERSCEPPSVVLAALGPVMLEMAGAQADGTATWMTGPKTLADHIVPTMSKAAEAAGRPAPKVLAALPVCLTDDPDGARAAAENVFAIYGNLPSYRAMLDREGAAGPGDVAIVGDEAAITKGIQALDDAGVTEFAAAIYGSPDQMARTRELLKTLL
jgi:F420-dependent oxidoreductase-like protein